MIITGALGTTIALSLLLLGLGSGRASFALSESHQAKNYASACAEEALQQINNLTSFEGSGNLAFGADACSYTVTNLGGNNREVTAYGSKGSVVRKIKITIDDLQPNIHIASWLELADF